jgi:hypothetical protein
VLKKLLIITLVLLLGYLTFFHPITSGIIFSRKPLLVKAFELAEYLLLASLDILWHVLVVVAKVLQFVAGIVMNMWTRYIADQVPSYDIRSHQELYTLYQEVETWSGLPWQIFWGLHAEETSLGRNLGSTTVINVLPPAQKPYFRQMCRELNWDPNQVYGSHKGALGPFQFIPETWMRHAVDGNGDGVRDPFNVEDAAYSAANYLLHKGAQQDLQKSIWHYNQDPKYVKRVMRYLKYHSG